MKAEDMTFLLNAFAASATVRTIDQLGILRHLAAGPMMAEDLALRCDADLRGIRVVLDGAVALGLLSHDDGHYAARPAAQVALGLFPAFDGLAERVHTGRAADRYETAAGANTHYPDAVPALASLMDEPATDAARHLARPGLEIVDVGAGAASWSLAIVKRASSCRVTAIDRPAVLEATRELVTSAGHEHAYRYRASDISREEIGSEAFDLALVGNVCHLFGEDVNRSLVARSYRALRPGGRLAVFEPHLDEDPLGAALYRLSLLARTAEGRVYSQQSYEQWMRDAGFRDVRTIELRAAPAMNAILAERPI